MKKIKYEYLIIGVFALFGLYGLDYISKLTGEWDFSLSVVSVMALGTIFLLQWKTYCDLKKIDDIKSRKKRIVYAFILSFLFASTMIVGYQLKKNGMTEAGYKGKGWILIRALCLSAAVFPFSNVIFKGTEYLRHQVKADVHKEWKKGRVFLLGWLFICLCWVPVFFAYYPVIMSFDFHRQAWEALNGFIWFNNHHPLIHTWLLWLFLHIGKTIGSCETGLALYSIFQMLTVSAVMSYSCTMLYRIVNKKWALILLLLFYAVFPFNSVFVLCATKDVLFGALFLLFILLLIERTFFCEKTFEGSTFFIKRKKIIIDIFLVLEGILMIMFRNNAIYAILVFIPFYLFMTQKKERLRILVICILLTAGGRFAIEGIQIAIGTEGRGSKSERYSVLIQQFARVGYYHGDSLNSETYELLDKNVSAEYWSKYEPYFADSVKRWVAIDNFVYHWKDNMGTVIRDWVKLGLQYPNEYLDAFLCLTMGYWFWDDTTYTEVLGSELEERKGAISTNNGFPEEEGVSVIHKSRLPKLEMELEKIVSGNRFYDWPVISGLFKASFYCWALLLLLLFLLYNGRKKEVMICLFPILYQATNFLGPVVQIRYIYPVMIVVPMLVGFLRMKQGSSLSSGITEKNDDVADR